MLDLPRKTASKDNAYTDIFFYSFQPKVTDFAFK